MRFILTVLRYIPELVWALIFVMAVGAGSAGDYLALTVDVVGFTCRFFAERIEEVERGPTDALRSTGAKVCPLSSPQCSQPHSFPSRDRPLHARKIDPRRNHTRYGWCRRNRHGTYPCLYATTIRYRVHHYRHDLGGVLGRTTQFIGTPKDVRRRPIETSRLTSRLFSTQYRLSH